jgi:CheY-like chemotaxis protein
MNAKMLNVLLVEDDEIDAMNVRRAFQKNRIANPLYVAGDGIEALETLRAGQVPEERRLILLDLNMPRMNGLEFLRELRNDPQLKGASVVVLTTSDDDRDRVEAYNLNVAGYILKPVTFENFCEAMATLNKYWTLVELP